MDIKLKEIERQESIKSLDNINKSLGNDLPKISISTSQSSNIIEMLQQTIFRVIKNI